VTQSNVFRGGVQCAAVCCSVLQCVAMYCIVLHCVAGCCSVLTIVTQSIVLRMRTYVPIGTSAGACTCICPALSQEYRALLRKFEALFAGI